MASVTIKFKRGYSFEWEDRNPILSLGEPGLERDTGLFKIGDGSTRWNDLAYSVGEGGGLPGPEGPEGPEGPQGPQGIQGPRGLTGPAGSIGPTGPEGPEGPIGLTGSTGAQGPQGIQGTQGIQGPSGTGEAGDQGPAGPQGDPGPAGADGEPGPQGPQGIQGVQGPAGVDGADGAEGPEGPQGPTGAQGAQGSAGADGSQGPTGAQGATGPTGAKGLNWRGVYSGAAAYAVDDGVIHQGSAYKVSNAPLAAGELAPGGSPAAVTVPYPGNGGPISAQLIGTAAPATSKSPGPDYYFTGPTYYRVNGTPGQSITITPAGGQIYVFYGYVNPISSGPTSAPVTFVMGAQGYVGIEVHPSVTSVTVTGGATAGQGIWEMLASKGDVGPAGPAASGQLYQSHQADAALSSYTTNTGVSASVDATKLTKTVAVGSSGQAEVELTYGRLDNIPTFDLFVDGVNKGRRVPGNASGGEGSIKWIFTGLTPGNHTFDLQWWIASGTATLYRSVINALTFTIRDPTLLGPKGDTGDTGTVFTRSSTDKVTASIADGVTETSALVLHPSVRLFKVATSRAARVRIYATAAQRTADAARPIGTDPIGNHGLLFEFVTSADILSYTLTPAVDLTADGSDSTYYVSVTNLSGATGVVTTTFYYVRTE